MFRRRLRSLLAGAMLLTMAVGQGCTNAPSAATVSASKPVTLTIWGVIDDVDVYEGILKDYHTLHPNVTLNYRRFRLEEYEDQLVNALAEDRGPDIFMVHNDWITKYQPKLQPMPLTTKVAIQEIQGTIQKKAVYVLQNQSSISLKNYKDQFADVVAKDTIRTINVSTKSDSVDYQDRIMALPLSVDTLGMYVNKDLLNAAGIATVPTTWDTFQGVIPKLVKQDADGNLVQAGAALGTADNVDRSTDIVAALMMQNGAEMTTDDGSPTFAQVPPALQAQRDQPPAYQALSFYTDFADPQKSVYTWNVKQPDALDSFAQGKSAFFFGYSYDLPTIRAQAPKLNLGIAQLPQIDGSPTVNFANYWAWGVSKKSKTTDLAWNFLNFMIKPDEAKQYLDLAKRPAAEKSLLTAQLDSEDIGVFASQVLTSKAWYRGADPNAVEVAFKTMIMNALTGVEDVPTAVRDAQEKVAQTLR